MTPAALPLKLSAVSMRMAGYMIENNLRVAHAFGQAAVASNPFMARVKVKASGTVAKSAKATSASSTKTSGSLTSVQIAKSKSVSPALKKSVAQSSVATPKAPVNVVKKAKPVAKAVVVKPVSVKPTAPKVKPIAAAPKPQPAEQAVKPMAKPSLPQATAPIKTAIEAGLKKTDSQPVITVKPVKTVASKPAPVARTEPKDDFKLAAAKSRREPATPPKMPAAPKVQMKPAGKNIKK